MEIWEKEIIFKNLDKEAGKYFKDGQGRIRKGQAMYNAASDLYPDITRKILLTEYDCFFDDRLIEKFKERIIYYLEGGK